MSAIQILLMLAAYSGISAIFVFFCSGWGTILQKYDDSNTRELKNEEEAHCPRL